MSIIDMTDIISKKEPFEWHDFIEFMILVTSNSAELMERIYNSDVEWKDDALRKLSILFYGDQDYKKNMGK